MVRRRACSGSPVCSLLAIACTKTPDPLAEQRAECRALEEKHELRPGLAVEECARKLKETADLSDPSRRAADLVDRIVHLATHGGATDKRSYGMRRIRWRESGGPRLPRRSCD